MKKVLLIEDDTVVRENTAELLELAAYRVFTASNGKDGVIQAKSYKPDIIICDIMMPELDGYGVLQILSKEDTTKHIPFIFLSAKTEHKDIRKGMDMGADDYITKPFNETELISAIESRLAKIAIMNELIDRDKETTVINYSANKIKTLDDLKKYFTDKGIKCLFKSGETIYQEGDNSNYLYLIYKGVIKSYKSDEQGKELITDLYKSGDLFGITSFIQNIAYKETTTAIEDSVLFRLSKQETKNILLKNHTVTLNLIDYLTDNVLEIKEQLLQMAYSSVTKKTASTILQFANKMNKNSEEGIRISRSDLASVAGIATETFIRTLSNLKKDGIIGIEGRNIKILNMVKLKNILV